MLLLLAVLMLAMNDKAAVSAHHPLVFRKDTIYQNSTMCLQFKLIGRKSMSAFVHSFRDCKNKP